MRSAPSAKPDRLACLVPFCSHTRKSNREFQEEWICGIHWRLIDRRKRYLFRAYARRWNKYRAADDYKKAEEFWTVCRRQAIERAAGI